MRNIEDAAVREDPDAEPDPVVEPAVGSAGDEPEPAPDEEEASEPEADAAPAPEPAPRSGTSAPR